MNNKTVSSIMLIGMPASGKTSCAQLLKDEINCLYLDSDSLIETSYGKPINAIFEEQGESYFRSLERSFVIQLKKSLIGSSSQSISQLPEEKTHKILTSQVDESIEALKTKGQNYLVVSTGGGMPVNKENLSDLKSIGMVVYLYCQSKILVERLSDDNSRPLISSKDKTSPIPEEIEPIKEKVNRFNRITSLLSERDSLYRMAHCTIDTSFQSQKQVVNALIQSFNEWKSNEDF